MQLEENLLQRVNTLVEGSDVDFWRKGRFLVRTDTQLVSYKDGMLTVNCVEILPPLLLLTTVESKACFDFHLSLFISSPLLMYLSFFSFRNDTPIKIMENLEYP
jgi:hypothetical protein